MRYAKDSFALFNPRQFYWEELFITQRRYLTRPLTFATFQRFNVSDMLSKNITVFFYHYNRLMESVTLYLPKNKRLVFSPHWWVFSVGFGLGCVLHDWEARLWKERKWDVEPGSMLPVRRPTLRRVLFYCIFMKWKMMLYYNGLFVNQKDLDMYMDVEHLAQGRLYRRTLAMEYAYKEKRIAMRDDRYDFLDLTPQHGLAIS